MKKINRFAAAVVAAGLAVGMVLGGCAQNSEDITGRGIKLSDYVTIGEYKGIAVDKITVTEYTEDNFVEDVNTYLDYYGHYDLEEIKDRTTVQKGDTASIDFKGMKDGVEFEGGSGSKDLTIGSGSFIPGFEEGLIGKEVGETVSLDLTFPENYGNEELAGAAVTFEVKINKIGNKKVKALTDELAKELWNYDTADQFKEAMISSTNTSRQEEADQTMNSQAIEAVVDAAVVSGYPEEVHKEYYDYYYGMYEYYAEQYKTDLDGILKQMNMTQEDLDKKCTEYADAQTKYYLVLMSIAQAENITYTEEEYQDYLAKKAEENHTEVEEYLKTVTERQVKDDMICTKAIDIVMENANYNEKPAESTSAAE